MPPVRRALHRVVHHPRTDMAVKAAVAATVSWLVARNLPGDVADYSYYAPLGAISTAYPAVARSASEGLRTVVAIMLGAAVGVAADQLPVLGLLKIPLVIAIGVALAGIPWLGAGASYVPIAGVFTLLLGQGEEVGYGVSYAGLFLLGAACTIVLNAALPSLPVEGADRAIARLRRACADHLEALADALGGPPEDDVVLPDPAVLTETLVRARAAAEEMQEAARANRRARRDPDAVGRRAAEFRALERTVLLVDDLEGLSEDAPWGTTVESIPAQLRGPIADALRELAAATREVALTDREPGRRVSADRAVAALAASLREFEHDGGSESVALVVSSVVTTLRRSLSALTPGDRIRLSTGPLPVRTDPPAPAPGAEAPASGTETQTSGTGAPTSGTEAPTSGTEAPALDAGETDTPRPPRPPTSRGAT